MGVFGFAVLALWLKSEAFENESTIEAFIVLRKYGFHTAQVESTTASRTHKTYYAVSPYNFYEDVHNRL
jgi:hypothetical protein